MDSAAICPECGHGDGEHEFLCERGVKEIRERVYGDVAATTSAWRRFRADMGCSKAVAKFNTVECQNRRWWRAKHAHQDGLRRRYRRLAVAKKKVAA